MVWEIWPNVDQVDLFGQEAESREKYPALEDELYKLMQEDPYFSSLPEGLTREDIKLLDTLSFEREFGGMHHSADEVDAFFDQWVKSLSLMHALVKSVLTSCTEYRAKAKALAKALEQEKKAEEAQKKRLQQPTQRMLIKVTKVTISRCPMTPEGDESQANCCRIWLTLIQQSYRADSQSIKYLLWIPLHLSRAWMFLCLFFFLTHEF